MNGDNQDPPQAQPVAGQVALITLEHTTVMVAHLPDSPGVKQILIGPVIFALPLTEESRKALVQGLTGIEVAQRMDIPKK